MTTFVFRLKAPRPNFALDMTDDEREIMGRHAAHWQSYIDSGQMVVFGPVHDDTGSWGLGVVEADDEDEVRAFLEAILRSELRAHIKKHSEAPLADPPAFRGFEIRHD